MTTSDTTVPLAPFNGHYRCTGSRPGYLRHFSEGQPLKHGPDCEDDSQWLYFIVDNHVREELAQVLLDLSNHPCGHLAWVDRLFSEGDDVNLHFIAEPDFDQRYRVTEVEEKDDNYVFRLQALAEHDLNPALPMYSAEHPSRH